jgi:alpha-glucosidase (family GH31 glycosyl hydrolase)
MGFFRENGFKVVPWLTPFVNVSSFDEKVPGQNLGKAQNYQAAADAGFFVRAANGQPLLADWWKGKGSPRGGLWKGGPHAVGGGSGST